MSNDAGECHRCGRETDATTLDGKYRCESCQDVLNERDTTRDAEQEGLDGYD